MKITCPGCAHEADVPEDKIPIAGVTASCPKCSTQFKVQRPEAPQPPPSASDDFELFCPKCGLQQPVSEMCIKCGILFAKITKTRADKDRQKSPPEPTSKPGRTEENQRPSTPNKNARAIVWVLGLLSFGLLGAQSWFAPLSFAVFTGYLLRTKGYTMRNACSFGVGALLVAAFLMGPVLNIDMKTDPPSPKVSAKPTPSRVEAPTSTGKIDLGNRVTNDVNYISLMVSTEVHGTVLCLGYLIDTEMLEDKSVIGRSISKYKEEKATVEERLERLYNSGKYSDFVAAAEEVHALCDEVMSSADRLMSGGKKPDYRAVRDAAIQVNEKAEAFMEKIPGDLIIDSAKPVIAAARDANSGLLTIVGLQNTKIENQKKYEQSTELANYAYDVANGIEVDMKEMLDESFRQQFNSDERWREFNEQRPPAIDGSYRQQISHLTGREQRLFSAYYQQLNSEFQEYYRNSKAIQFYKVDERREGNRVEVNRKLLLYTGRVQDWGETYYCDLDKVLTRHLLVTDLTLDTVKATKYQGRTPGRIDILQRKVADRVCR